MSPFVSHFELGIYFFSFSAVDEEVGSKTFGDALDGHDIDDCRVDDDDCQTLHCQHHGICTVPFEDNSDGVSSSAYCQCPLGFDGQFCETPVEVQVPPRLLHLVAHTWSKKLLSLLRIFPCYYIASTYIVSQLLSY